MEFYQFDPVLPGITAPPEEDLLNQNTMFPIDHNFPNLYVGDLQDYLGFNGSTGDMFSLAAEASALTFPQSSF